MLLALPACGASPVGDAAHPPAVGSSTTATPGPVKPASTTGVSTASPSTDASTTTAPTAPDGPLIVITKSERRLALYVDGQVVRTYRIALGFAPTGDKEKEGDGRTPEGRFYVCVRNPAGKFGASLGISYPGTDDAERGLRTGAISQTVRDQIVAAIDAGRTPPQKTALGGEIYIHAGGAASDWTAGCVALDEPDMKELFAAVPAGTPVIIDP